MRLVNKSYAHLYGYDVINMPCRRISTQSHPFTKFKFKITKLKFKVTKSKFKNSI